MRIKQKVYVRVEKIGENCFAVYFHLFTYVLLNECILWYYMYINITISL